MTEPFSVPHQGNGAGACNSNTQWPPPPAVINLRSPSFMYCAAGEPGMADLVRENRQARIVGSLAGQLRVALVRDGRGLHPDGIPPTVLQPGLARGRVVPPGWPDARNLGLDVPVIKARKPMRRTGRLLVHAELAVEGQQVEMVAQDLDDPAGDVGRRPPCRPGSSGTGTPRTVRRKVGDPAATGRSARDLPPPGILMTAECSP